MSTHDDNKSELVTNGESGKKARTNSSAGKNQSDSLNENKCELLHFVLSIPTIGEYLTFGIAVAPIFILVLALIAIWEDGSSWTVLIAFPFALWWLRLLERRCDLTICLPIPIINIPVKWFVLPLFAFWLFMIVFNS